MRCNNHSKCGLRQLKVLHYGANTGCNNHSKCGLRQLKLKITEKNALL